MASKDDKPKAVYPALASIISGMTEREARELLKAAQEIIIRRGKGVN